MIVVQEARPKDGWRSIRTDRWGYVQFDSRKILCLRLDWSVGEKLVFIEPGGGPMFPDVKNPRSKMVVQTTPPPGPPSVA